jgi:2,6-dihydroxypyridine 3-monooxygenase
MGGSLGGLTAALVLRDRGCEVEVHERSSAPLRGRGAGIVLHPATIRWLVESGARRVDELGVPVRTLRYLAPDGATAAERDCRYRFSSYSAIYDDLRARLEPRSYRLGSEIAAFEDEGSAVSIEPAEGPRRRFDLLVCADGVRSTARALLTPEVATEYAGYVAWRGAVAEARLDRATFDPLHGAVTYHVMTDGHVLVYPIPAGERTLNWLWYRNVEAGPSLDRVLTDSEGRRRYASVPPGHVEDDLVEELRAAAAERLPPQLSALVAATEQPFLQAVFDLAVPRMAFGRVCLIGDAAFALRPHLAAGTAKAAEDAWRLGDAMAACRNDPPAALARWEPGQLALGRNALRRAREAGERAQFRNAWRDGDPLPFGLYEQGDSALG